MKIFTTDTYYNVFNILTNVIDKTPSATLKNVIFCEEKISLMVERSVCQKLGGTFSTRVYSFGKYLKSKAQISNAVTKEGSVMIIKKLLSNKSFKCFKAEKNNLAVTVYNAIRQLKSAKIYPEDILNASKKVGTLLRNKLEDISLIYTYYENYLKENSLEDQGSILSYLPDVIENDNELKDVNVYIVGYTSFTAQIREIIEKLIKKAKEVYAILPRGDNSFVYVNETASAIEQIANNTKEKIETEQIKTNQLEECKKIQQELFSPIAKFWRLDTEKIKTFTAVNSYQEMEMVAEIIKNKVICEGKRYRDFKVVLPNLDSYVEETKKAFSLLDVPYFINTKKIPLNHPLVSLIFGYIDSIRRNWERDTLSAFYKNPLFCEDKDFVDRFENYLLKNNVNFFDLKNPFSEDGEEVDLSEFNKFREKIVNSLRSFNVKRLLTELNVIEKIEKLSTKLEDKQEFEEKAVSEQIYQAVMGVIEDVEYLLSGVELSLVEYKNILKSGISAMEISLIPQYNDAVFIGGYHESAVAVSPYVFCVGLTSAVPNVSSDVALLTDDDINVLSDLKVLVEPKIRVVNHRTREQTAMGISSFSKELYLSYPENDFSGGANVKSEIFNYFTSAFATQKAPRFNGYISKAQGLNSFARDCNLFSELKLNDFENATCYFKTCKSEAQRILDYANSEMKVRLDNFSHVLIKDLSSATAIEEYNKCPYKYFIEKGLRVQEREKGELSNLSTGILMHDVFCKFIKALSQNQSQSFEQLFSNVQSEILSSPKYKVFLNDSGIKAQLEYSLEECKDFCKNTLDWIDNSSFKPNERDVEVKFGDGCRYPAVELNKGVKISGTIDRIDTFNDYFRIIDYKTGSVSGDDKELFAGTKLQLYLYAKALKDRKVAGIYYLPVNAGYKRQGEKPIMAVGKTVDDGELIYSQDATIRNGEGKYLPIKVVDGNVDGVISAEKMSEYVNYAVKISQKTIDNMLDGFIAPTPVEKQCTYCEYSSLCKNSDSVRKIKSVSNDVFFEACNASAEERNNGN